MITTTTLFGEIDTLPVPLRQPHAKPTDVLDAGLDYLRNREPYADVAKRHGISDKTLQFAISIMICGPEPISAYLKGAAIGTVHRIQYGYMDGYSEDVSPAIWKIAQTYSTLAQLLEDKRFEEDAPNRRARLMLGYNS